MPAAAMEQVRDPLAVPKTDGRIQTLRVRFYEGKVKSQKKLTHDTYELVVKCGPESAIGEAGQFWTIHVPGLDKPRPYSFARAPGAEKPGEHTFFIRVVPGGKFSQWLEEKDQTGTEVTLSGPLGKFRRDPSDQDMVCIAGGSGMSAIYAIIEQAVADQVQRNCYFFYGARTQKDLYMQKEIEKLVRGWHPDYTMKFVPVLNEEPDDSDWGGARGLVTDYFRDHYLNPGHMKAADIKAYFCGPPPMIDAGIAVLKNAGVSDSDIFYDKFEDARSPVPVIDNTKCVLCDECLMVKPVQNCITEVARLKKDGADGAGTMGYELIEPSETSGLYYNTLYINEKECIRCYACIDACPAKAISPSYDSVPTTLRRVVN